MMIENGIQNSIAFTDKGPRKGWRTPLNIINDSEQRDEEKEGSRGPFASERGDEPRSGIPNGSTYSYTYFGARYMDHELMTMWLSVDPMVDKYPSISPYAYCAWNPVKLVDPDGRDTFDDIGWWKNKKTNNMEWDPEIHNQEEQNNKYGNGAGIYKGLTHEENGIYYSLFGTTEKPNSKQGRFTKKMDEVCINHAAWMRSQLKGTDRQETPVDFTGIEKMKDRADKKGFFPTTGENVRDGYSYFCGRANGRMYVTGNMRGTWGSSWSDILRKTNQDVNSNMRTGLYGYYLRVGNVVLIQFNAKADAVAFKDIFYKIFPNVKL